MTQSSEHKRIDDADFLRIIADCLFGTGEVELEESDLLRFEVIAVKLEKKRKPRKKAQERIGL